MGWESMMLGSGEGPSPSETAPSASFALGTFSGPKADLIVGDVDLTEDEFERYQGALDPLHRLEDRLTFRMVERNFKQLTALHRYYENLFAQAKEKGRIDARDAG